MKKTVWKKGTKLTALVLAGVMSVSLLAGCGKANDKDDQGRTIVSVGGWPTKQGSIELENAEKRKEMFETSNPDVVIEPNTWAFDLKSFYAKAAGGQLPTVYDTHMTEVPAIKSAGYSSDLTAALKKYGIYDKINADLRDYVSEDGKTLAFPYATYALGLAYNVNLFEQAGLMEADGTPKQPKTWDEVVEFAVKIKEATGKAGFIFPSSNNNGGWIFTCLAWSFGANFMEKDSDGKWKALFNSPEAAEALQWIKDMKWKYDVLPANTLIDGTELYKLFGTGEAGFLICAGDYPRKVTQYGMAPNDSGIMALPAGPKKHVTLMGGSVYAIADNATEDQVDAGIRYLLQGNSPELTEEIKVSKLDGMKKNLADNQLVGIESMSVWSADSPARKYELELIRENANCNLNHVKLYNEFVADLGDCELRSEEPVCTQELYGVLDGCIQEVLINKDADPASLLEKAAADFQANYLDNLDY